MSRRPLRPARVSVENLEPRLAMSAATDPVVVYTWQFINEMRANPSRFADEVQALYDGKPGTYQGYAATDPVWTDIRKDIDRKNTDRKHIDGINPANAWSLAATLGFLRSQPNLPAYSLQDDLSAQAAAHVSWMEQHGYAHSGTTTSGSALPSFSATPAASPDPFVHDDAKYAWPGGENINYGFNTDWAFEAAYQSGNLSRDGFIQRLAYVSAMSYILDVGQPELGHLRNLLGRPDGPSTQAIGQPGFSNFDSIGIDEALLSYMQDADVPNYYISTMRFDNVRDNVPHEGQYEGISFTDANRNGLFDIGESYQLTPDAGPTVTIPPVAPIFPIVVVGPAPQVTGLQSIRAGRKGLTSVVVSFDAAMDAGSATDLGAYLLTSTAPGRKARAKPVRLVRASYDATTHAVTLTLAKPFRAKGRLNLSIATGPKSASSGLMLASVFSGRVPR